MKLDDLPRLEFADPGPLRDQVVAAILAGAKTTTTGLALRYERAGEPVPEAGQQFAVAGSDSRPVAVIEMTEVEWSGLPTSTCAMSWTTVMSQWRAAHEEFWHSAEMREVLGDPGFTVDDDTAVLAQRFRLVRAVEASRLSEISGDISRPD